MWKWSVGNKKAPKTLAFSGECDIVNTSGRGNPAKVADDTPITSKEQS